ncbi:MAG: methyltransferase domain-containing protein [Candidatus Hydrogenedentes bacterium]|nr:methyltransferase domain-containing protein [Candidatus Hydrogenedentota bacterium]
MNFYDHIKPQLMHRIGREIRLARRVLDIGCGPCDLVQHLADTYQQDVTGVDISRRSFPRAQRTRAGHRFRCFQRDAAILSFALDASVDAVVSVWALHEMERPQAVLTEVRRVLRPGGELLIVDFPKGSLAQKLWNEDYYDPDEVSHMLVEAGFSEVKVRRIERLQVMWAQAQQPALQVAPR